MYVTIVMMNTITKRTNSSDASHVVWSATEGTSTVNGADVNVIRQTSSTDKSSIYDEQGNTPNDFSVRAQVVWYAMVVDSVHLIVGPYSIRLCIVLSQMSLSEAAIGCS
jgi:hypothetical protein